MIPIASRSWSLNCYNSSKLLRLHRNLSAATPRLCKKQEASVFKDSEEINHFKQEDRTKAILSEKKSKYEAYTMPHPIWSQEDVESVKIKHQKPVGAVDTMAYRCVQILRKSFDLFSGYTIGSKLRILDEKSVINRILFLETVAGIPGFTAAMVRHLHSLRRMQRDHGWIHTLLEEAENERMHLMTFLQLRKPGPLFRGLVVATQFAFSSVFFLAYLISPKFCHRFVGYLEEEAVTTYSHIIQEIDEGRLPVFKEMGAPDIAIQYWQLDKDAKIREVLLAIRADEAHHRTVNHTLASMKLRDKNPFKPGQ